MSKELQDVLPREQNGRDSFERYRLQVRSASIAALTILEGSEIDRVYCDLHDDFVTRKSSGGYEFFQVKTKSKQNYNWKVNDIFGIKTRGNNQSNESIRDSFIGKLLMHTVVFDENCHAIVFQTNINNDDNVESMIKDIESGEFTNKYTNILVDRFNDFLSITDSLTNEQVKSKIKKLKFVTDVQYLKPKNNNYDSIVRDTIYKYSEVDLDYNDITEIITRLLELVSDKSSGKLENWDKESIEKQSGVSLSDLLSILSISEDAYNCLINGGDRLAIKSVSIIQRYLESAGANDEMITYCSQCKTDWDSWYRNSRHNVFQLDLDYITQKIEDILDSNLVSNGGFINTMDLRVPIKKLVSDLKTENILYGLNENLIFGGIFSEIVRRKS